MQPNGKILFGKKRLLQDVLVFLDAAPQLRMGCGTASTPFGFDQGIQSVRQLGGSVEVMLEQQIGLPQEPEQSVTPAAYPNMRTRLEPISLGSRMSKIVGALLSSSVRIPLWMLWVMTPVMACAGFSIRPYSRSVSRLKANKD